MVMVTDMHTDWTDLFCPSCCSILIVIHLLYWLKKNNDGFDLMSLIKHYLYNKMFDELWSEIQDSQGEIFDVIEYKEEWEKEEKFDVEKYINGNTDY